MKHPANDSSRTGAGTVIQTLLQEGVSICFGNPGTSEMHFVAGLEAAPQMRCILGLFEGVVTGAADGYARMTDKAAATLLHLGPGLANGLANLHNAKRASSPMVNIVGEHATWHKGLDSPLTSDIETLARPMCDWVATVDSPEATEALTREAVRTANALPGHVTTLIVPADISWTPAPPTQWSCNFGEPADRRRSDPTLLHQAATALTSSRKGKLIIGGRALRAEALASAARIAARTGAGLLAPYGSARIERGAGRVNVPRIAHAAGQGPAAFEHCDFVVLVGAPVPVAMFGYPGRPSTYLPASCEVIDLAESAVDLSLVLCELEDLVGAARTPILVGERVAVAPPTGALTPDKVLQTVAALMPEQAIVVDESISAGRRFFSFTGSPRFQCNK